MNVKNLRRAGVMMSSLVMTAGLFFAMNLTAQAANETDGVGAFVNRCYEVTLNREADSTGYEDWTSQLLNGKSDGANVAYGFVFSKEYTEAAKSNEEFVTDMYTLFMDRDPDQAGYEDWVGQLNNGADRQDIFTGFANSKEFFNICTNYGVTAGVHNSDYDRAQVNNVNMFVARLYKICFNRLGDQDGQTGWVNSLLNGDLSGIDCAHGFIYSDEYQGLELSNEAYVENMYYAFMGRQSDPTGLADWVGRLEAGYTRDEIFAGFANSNEFQSICNDYGINCGSYAPADVHVANPADGDVAEVSGENLDQKNCSYFRLDNMDTSIHSTFYAPSRGQSYKDGHIHPVINFWSDEACDVTVKVTAENPDQTFLLYNSDGPEGPSEPVDYMELWGENYTVDYADPASSDATTATFTFHIKKGANSLWVDCMGGGKSCNIEVSTVSGNASLRYLRTQYAYDTHNSSY